MTPGDRLRQARLLAGFKSATKAAAAAGMSESSYRAHENGQNAFTPEQAQHYASVFGCDPVWLLIGPYAEVDDDGPAETIAAVTLSSSAILAALVQSLHDKGVLSGEETVELYETALLLLEQQQAMADATPGLGRIMDMARELIEKHLRPE
jgi:transcriptional regulator with XRE-family HTH domain